MLVPLFLCLITMVIILICLAHEVEQGRPGYVVAHAAMLCLMAWLSLSFYQLGL